MKNRGNGISDYSDFYPVWDNVLHDYLEFEHSLDLNTEDSYKQTCMNLAKVLSEILTFYSISCKARDNFSEPFIDCLPMGLAVFVRSEKMKVKFSFGVYENRFFLESFIDHPWHLKSMDDKFWHQLTKLGLLGNFRFLESAGPCNSESEAILKKVKGIKSNIFNMILNYALLESEGGAGDFGSLEVSWPIDLFWNDLLTKGSEGFKILYRTNYKLYRANYLNMKSRKNTLR